MLYFELNKLFHIIETCDYVTPCFNYFSYIAHLRTDHVTHDVWRYVEWKHINTVETVRDEL